MSRKVAFCLVEADIGEVRSYVLQLAFRQFPRKVKWSGAGSSQTEVKAASRRLPRNERRNRHYRQNLAAVVRRKRSPGQRIRMHNFGLGGRPAFPRSGMLGPVRSSNPIQSTAGRTGLRRRSHGLSRLWSLPDSKTVQGSGSQTNYVIGISTIAVPARNAVESGSEQMTGRQGELDLQLVRDKGRNRYSFPGGGIPAPGEAALNIDAIAKRISAKNWAFKSDQKTIRGRRWDYDPRRDPGNGRRCSTQVFAGWRIRSRRWSCGDQGLVGRERESVAVGGGTSPAAVAIPLELQKGGLLHRVVGVPG